MRRLAPALALVLAVLAACSEEDRKAWVSILPGGGEEQPADAAVEIPPGFALAADSTVAFLNGDTLVTVERLPDRAPGGATLVDARFGAVALSPDSSHMAFALRGEETVVGIWSRARQSARLVPLPEGADVEAFEWAPVGAYVAWRAARPDGVTTVGVYDLRSGRSRSHPVLAWLLRNGRSVRLQGWIDPLRLRLLVGPDAEPEGGLAWLWEMRGGSLLVESHVEPISGNAPPGSELLPGGVFSADLIGDSTPETVALYRSEAPAPAALVLRERAGTFTATATDPLIAPEVIGLASWEGIERGAGLSQVVDVPGGTVLLLSVPTPETEVSTLGFFEVAADGSVAPVMAAGPEGPSPALFPDGRAPDRLFRLGLVDLDGDGTEEVVSAAGRQDPSTFEARVQWGAQVWRWVRGRRLEPAPDLESAALDRLDRMTTGE